MILGEYPKKIKKDDGSHFDTEQTTTLTETQQFMAIRSSTLMQGFNSTKHEGTNVKTWPVVVWKPETQHAL